LFKYALNNIAAFSSAPLQITTMLGVIFLFGAMILSFITLYNYIIGQAAEGFTTVILIILIIGSIQMISLGILGFYISNIYIEVKRRPKYIIREFLSKTLIITEK